MLSRLQVRNFVLIDSLEIDFPEGLIIITGQTGAGKSILLGALSLIMGSKADASMISSNAENCVVEAEFDVDPNDAALQEELDENGVEYIEANGNTNDEVIQAASALVGAGVDAIFTPTDNVIMAAELAIAPMFAEAGIPHFTGADSFVRNGAFATCGVNYTDLGKKTADLAYDAMTKGMADMEDYYLMDGGIVTVNTETAEAIGFDYKVLADFGELVEVVTTED
jgi:ABC-type uncharacterized transport system substrate-binding protein